MDWTLEVVVMPVSDIDRSIVFYRDQVGFALDHDTITPQMHVTQLTPVGSGCCIVCDGPGMQAMEPGSTAFRVMIASGLGLAWIGEHRGRAGHGGTVRRSCGDARTQES